MIFYKKSDRPAERGFIYVASRSVMYYELAIQACETMRDYFPDAHVTLFTHQSFLDGREKIFDNVVVDIPIFYRTKMWAMARTPYEKTIYIDADSVIMHKDIRTMHDHLDDCDMFFCPVTLHTPGNPNLRYMDKSWTIPPQYHGAISGYNKKDLTIDFMQTWYDEYIKQACSPGWPYDYNHYKDWKPFDMFTLWRLTNSEKFPEFSRFADLNIKLLPLRYIITAQHTAEEKRQNRPVIHQVDKHTWTLIPSFWKKVEARKKDEIYTTKEFPTYQAPTKYN